MSETPGSELDLRLGVVVDAVMRGQALTQAIASKGFKVNVLLLAAHCRIGDLQKASETVDAWLVDVDFDSDGMEPLHNWTLETPQPVIVGEAIPYESKLYLVWVRRVLDKLPQLAGQARLAQSPVAVGKQIWVVGASTGGPEAVKLFFQQLPARLDVSFLYVQHIDAGFERNLMTMLKSTNYRPFIVSHGDVLQANSIAILRQDEVTDVFENGTLQTSSEPWRAAYAPSIDQVLANVARRFPGRCGAIIFSGMGDDGAKGARLVAQRGGQVWVQSPESCAVSAMPEAVMKNVTVNGMGTPVELAEHLSRQLQLPVTHQALGSYS